MRKQLYIVFVMNYIYLTLFDFDLIHFIFNKRYPLENKRTGSSKKSVADIMPI